MEMDVHMQGELQTTLVAGLGGLAFVSSGCACGTRRATLQSPALAGSPRQGKHRVETIGQVLSACTIIAAVPEDKANAVGGETRRVATPSKPGLK